MVKPKEVLLWSIALPGFGQLINGKYIKGIFFIILEIVINVQGNFNLIIMHSFQGKIDQAITDANYQWLLFYPCLYFFGMWDAMKDAGGMTERYSSLPFVSSAYFVTVGCLYSSTFKIYGVLLGPVWLPILSVLPGLIAGFFLKQILNRRIRK